MSWIAFDLQEYFLNKADTGSGYILKPGSLFAHTQKFTHRFAQPIDEGMQHPTQDQDK